LPLQPEHFAADLVLGVQEHLPAIDEIIGRLAVGWPVGRMPVIDRNVLRLGAYELLDHPEIPVGVIISEAVELARLYSTEESGRFVNGVLSAVAAEVRPG